MGLNSQDRKAGIVHPGQNKEDMTARTYKHGQDSWDMTNGTGLTGRPNGIGLTGQVYRARIAQPKKVSLDRSV
jgi:hypothetical protein